MDNLERLNPEQKEGIYESQIYDKLKEAELQALESSRRRGHKEVMGAAHSRLENIKARRKHRA